MNSYKHYVEMIEIMDYSFEKRRNIPGLILLYSTIDSFSGLVNIDNSNRKEIFMNWVEKWMLKKYPLPISKYDIYSARCGLLHQHVTESDMIKRNEAKHIHYVYGNGDVAFLQKLFDKEGLGKNVVVQIEDLINSFKLGIESCWSAIRKDDDWLNSVYEKSEKLLCTIKIDSTKDDKK